MKNKALKVGSIIGAFLGGTIIAYAITSYFTTGELRLEPTPKHYFEININDENTPGEIGPGDSFSTSPVVHNDATEEMYVFIKVEMPDVNGEPLYTFSIGEGWTLVEDGVYAYADGGVMTTLTPGDSTTSFTTQMSMKAISRADFAALEDISVKITGYAIGTEDVDMNPEQAWGQCKVIGNIE